MGLPPGKVFLWALSNLWLALLLTFLPARDQIIQGECTGKWLFPSVWEGILAMYAISYFCGEVQELCSHFNYYIKDPFNMMDLIGTVCLTGSTICRLLQDPCPSSSDPRSAQLYWGMGFQAFAAWMFWMRLTKLLYIIPNYGLMLLMTLRMLGDLWEFIVLLGFLFVSFSAQLYVWLSLWPHYLGAEGDHPVLMFLTTSWRLWYNTVMNGAPSEFIDTSDDPDDAITMYAAGP